MVSVRFKLVWIIVGIALAYAFVANAQAQTVTFDPPITTCGTYTMTVDIPVGYEMYTFAPDNYWYDSWSSGVYTAPLDELLGANVSMDCNDAVPLMLGEWNLVVANSTLFGDDPCNDFVNNDDYGECVANSVYYDSTVSTFTFDNLSAGATQTWGNGGLWGEDFQTQDVTDTLQASVQATGADIWPLLSFAGIALAFVIFLNLVFYTRSAVQVAEFDDKKADELKAFYSKTGNADPTIVTSIRKGLKQDD